ncbi:MAG TPA: hypothetical protein VG142_16940 [Trebonia sp.]|jgi:hypothetical protein|nr:hypothetical protein [Trebonia sp.]
MAGYDTAGEIQRTYISARAEFRADPNFWLRYFTPSPYADVVESDPARECAGAWDSGGPRIGPVMAPDQSRLSGSPAEGLADAETFCAAIYSTYTSVGPLQTPANGMLFCWLDEEYSATLSVGYWNGWADYVAGYEFGNVGEHPLYACLYCAPYSPYPNCSTIGGSGAATCHAVWSSEPASCGTLTDPPLWHADSCTAAPTLVWQFGEQDTCGYSANVDLDVGAPGFNTAGYCFYLSSKP